jgi:hypothetical protein
MSEIDDEKTLDRDTVKMVVRFWRNHSKDEPDKRFRASGDYLAKGKAWPAGIVNVPQQEHAPGTGKRNFNNPFELMDAIQDALKQADVSFVWETP